MRDLIICINFSESKRKQGLIFETYLGKISNLKSKQFSGPLRKVDIDTIDKVNNLNNFELNLLKKYLYKKGNIQINKYQFIMDNNNLIDLTDKVNYSCFFYRDKNTPMYLLEHVWINIITEIDKEENEIKGIQYSSNKNNLKLSLVIEKKESNRINEIEPHFYINIDNSHYKAKLFFEYKNIEIDYADKNIQIAEQNDFRNYHFEKKVLNIIEESGWNYKQKGGFEYCGKNITHSISNLQENHIILYTNKKKKITIGKTIDMSVSYNMNWFEINGKIKTENDIYSIQELLDLRKNNNWVELENSVTIIPNSISNFAQIMNKGKQGIEIDKKYIGQVMYLTNELGISKIKNVEALVNYKDIVPNIKPEILNQLRDYQKIGVQWLLYLYENKFGGCLADDMGLGKTFQTIAYLSDKRFERTNNLIIVPKTLLLNWKREIEKFAPNLQVYVYHGGERNIEKAKKCEIILTTYGMVINDSKNLSSIFYANVIMDEAQNVKNSRTKAYIAINNLNANSKILLTGTPLENNIKELCALIRLSNPEIFLSFEKIIKKFDDEQSIIKNIKQMVSPFILRRIKEDVLKELPEKQEQVIYCKMDTLQEELYNKVLKSIQHEIKRKPNRFEIKSNSTILNGLLFLQQICCHPKLLSHDLNKNHCLESTKTDVLIDMLKSLNMNGHKVIVFSRFTKMLKIIEKRLIKENLFYCYLDGKTKDRMKVVDEFEKNEKGIFLVSLKAGGSGLNLVSADTAIIYDPWWNPAVEKQAEDRIYRIGQKKNVTIYRLIVANTIEEKIEELKRKKKNMADQILENEENITVVTMEVLKELLIDKME